MNHNQISDQQSAIDNWSLTDILPKHLRTTTNSDYPERTENDNQLATRVAKHISMRTAEWRTSTAIYTQDPVRAGSYEIIN